ncbi:MAG: mechanosensitive ion channel [Xanthomonadales bacterium]|jgi:small-conductance mechanosensitive channel|nr:mechanosensitive ion channel [Xanthomonadales bacterium]MDH4000423.1 mechanosensitive ion channel [Xanthomonadales bacterium]
MESISKFIALELFSVGGVSITIGQVAAASLTIAVVLVLAGWLIRRLSQRLLERGSDANQVQLTQKVLWFAVIVILFFTALSMLNVPLGAFAFITGAIAIGIGFGAQNIINNFISGWILMGERPIRIGDLLEVNGTLGRVEAINTRSTRIKRVDGVRIVIPNSHLLENMVVNWNLGDEDIRIFVTVGVAYGSPVRRVAELIEQAVTEQEGVLEDPEPRILFQDFGNSALIFEAYFWTQLKPGGDLRRLRSEIRFRIDELFRENGITIAFPQQDVHLDGILKLESGDQAVGQAIPNTPEES